MGIMREGIYSKVFIYLKDDGWPHHCISNNSIIVFFQCNS